VDIPEVRWDKEDTVRVGVYIFFSMVKERKIISWEQDFCTPQNSVSS